MLMAYRDYCNGENWGLKKDIHYGDYDLKCAIDWAEHSEDTHFPHDHDVDFGGFIRWAKSELKRQMSC